MHTLCMHTQISSFLCSSLFLQWCDFRPCPFLCSLFLSSRFCLSSLHPETKGWLPHCRGRCLFFFFKGAASRTWRSSQPYNWNGLLLGCFHRDYQRWGKEITSWKQIGLLWFLNSSNVDNSRKQEQWLHQQIDVRRLWLLVEIVFMINWLQLKNEMRKVAAFV